MSAFNNARFNLSKYNIEQGNQIWADGRSQVKFDFAFAGLTNFCYGNSRVSFGSDGMQCASGRMFRGNASTTFGVDNCKVIAYFNLKADYVTVIGTENNLSQIVNASGHADETFSGEINLSQIVKANGATSESFDTERMNLSQIVWTAADLGEVFAAVADVTAFTEFVCEFPDLILRPGQTLVIDASTYNVLLNGENAVHLQKGEWLDKLNRTTQSIVISGTGASRLTAEILYTERYL